MKQKFKPSYIFNSIQEIPMELFNENNIKGILLDIDNTLIIHSKPISKEVDSWIKKAISSGLEICILSNTWNLNKVKRIMNTYHIYGLHSAKKPSKKGFEMAVNILGLPKENIAMIGDQIFTDVVGANKFGICSIFVKPITKFEWFGTMIKRPFERIVLKLLEGEKNK